MGGYNYMDGTHIMDNVHGFGVVSPSVFFRARRGHAPAMRRRQSGFGFTLVELLVAMAIFVVLMAALTMLFVGSIRTTKVGYQQMKAFESARTAFGIIEDDLVRGFSSQANSDTYGFYGTPIGMTFIGVVNATGKSTDRNIARVTYVVFNQETGESFPEALEDYVLEDGVTKEVMRDAYQYSLLRYVEPGVADVDASSIIWTAGSGPGNLRLPNGTLSTVDFDFGAALNLLCGFDWTSASLTGEQDAFVRAKKCEIWIRMLAGGDVFPEWAGAGSSGPALPSFWEASGLDPANYVVASNILALKSESERYALPFITGESTSFFDYDLACRYLATTADVATGSHSKCAQNIWWNDPRSGKKTDCGDGCCDENCPLGNWGDTRLPEVVAANFWLMFESPYPGAPDFKRRFVLEVNLPSGYARSPEE
jgi:prepilin-type N-terminal cleavage/methylation domain-containing protein